MMTPLLKRALCLALLVLSMILLPACEKKSTEISGPREKVSIAAVKNQISTALIVIADQNGYFIEEGLDATIQLHTYGQLAMETMLSGKADLATSAETPVMLAIMAGEKLAVLATIESSKENEGLLVKKSSGIKTFSDLRGKRIGVTPGTSGEFFLDTMLTSGGLRQEDVLILSLAPKEMPEAMRSNRVDAVAVWNFPLQEMKNEFGDQVIILRDQTLYTSFFCLSTHQDYARTRKDLLIKVMRALVKAEDFIKDNPEQARRLLKTSLGLNEQLISQLWPIYSFKVSLNQSLLIILEDEAHWAINRNLVPATQIPNIAEYLYPDALSAARPAAVRLIR